MFHVPERFRIKKEQHALLGSDESYGNNGFFIFEWKGYQISCQASDSSKLDEEQIKQLGGQWEHVSVSINRQRTPSWDVMCLVKALFWDEEDTVIQYHPPKSEYINMHPYVLHLWRPIGIELPRPNKIMVGINPENFL